MATPRKALLDLKRQIKAVEREAFSRASVKSLAVLAKETLFRRVKAGFGVNNESSRRAKRKKLKPLSASYIEQRRRKGVRGSFGSVTRSNLTNTGKMLDSIETKIDSKSFTLIIPDSKRSDSDSTNAEIAGFNADSGRPFFALTVAEQDIIRNTLEKRIRSVLKSKL